MEAARGVAPLVAQLLVGAVGGELATEASGPPSTTSTPTEESECPDIPLDVAPAPEGAPVVHLDAARRRKGGRS